MKMNKRGQKLAAAMPDSYSKDVEQVEAWLADATGVTEARLMEYCARDGRVYVHSHDDRMLTGWVRGMSPLGLICYTQCGADLDTDVQIVDSATAWAEEHREHITRIAEHPDRRNSNGNGTLIEEYAL